jgi:hypothetical protein
MASSEIRAVPLALEIRQILRICQIPTPTP